MHYSFPPDVQHLIDGQLASGRYASEDDVLRNALQALQQVEDDAAAIQSSIDEWKNGDEGVSVDKAFETVRAEFRRKPAE